MKTIRQIGFTFLLICTAVACQESSLEDFSAAGGAPVLVSASTNTKNIAKTNESITATVGLTLSGPSASAFEIALRINQEAVETQIKDGTLKDAVAISAAAIQIDNVAKVSYGSDAAVFKITISRTEVERYFGKKIAIGYTLDNATKDNQVDKDNDTGVILFNTSELLTDEDIHYISLQTGGNIVEVRDRQNYTSTSGGITIPLTASLASFPGNAFSVGIQTNADTITTMVNQGLLPANTIALKSDQFTVSSKLNFTSNASEATFAVDVPWNTINESEGKHLAIVITLEDPTLHLVNPEKRSTTILIDCNNILEEDVTNLGVFSVNRDNGGGPDANEGSKKLIDNNYTTKFLQPDFTGDLEINLVYEEGQKIGAYTFTSGNDANQRDPKAWELLGSNDGVTWTTVDSRQNEVFENRLMTRRFNVSYPVAYTHYRLKITSIVGGTNLFQMTEWRMIKVH
ncbi:hypothetical protein HP439_01695 [Sphingobacterium shayense]|uniref:discoidin domain-containing protein n=1 Tax=Sphingobacterium shayense TaxID=626343 RepID=UPI0015564923|nr:discoidin domain-containing protein [Sphingobacterium shayense]NQD69437.1 hypothetical protein [Sphingobacterium shayense]